MSEEKVVIKGDVMQVMNLKNRGATTGAADIDVKDMKMIEFDAPVTIYWDGNTTDIFNAPANRTYGVANISTLHVSAAVNYIWV